MLIAGGLDLFLVKSQVKLMGGSINVDSKVNRAQHLQLK